MTQARSAAGAPAHPRSLGWQWWAAMLVVTLLLGFVGRADGGFWGVFLWSVVGFVVGSLVAFAVTGRGPASARDADGVTNAAGVGR